MRSLIFLAARMLIRSPARTALVVLGLSITGALLLDMTMLAHGLEADLGLILRSLGFSIRVLPRGGPPFSGDAEIAGGERLAATIAAHPGITAAVPVLGTNLYAQHGRDRLPAFAMGIPHGGTGVYRVLDGHDLPAATGRTARSGAGAPGAGPPLPPIVVSDRTARLDGVRIGDTLVLSVAPRTALAPYAAPRTFRVIGVADFYFDLATQRSVALRLADLAALEGRPSGSASLILVRLAEPSQAGDVARWIAGRDPSVDALTIPEFQARAGSRLTYFRQFSLILGTISAAVSFLLIAAIMVLSLGERLGEIAMLRALGITRGRIGTLVLLEGVCLSIAGLPGAFGLGLLISGYLDAILRSAPGVPDNIHFFAFTTEAAARTAALMLATGAAAGIYPAGVAARLNVAGTLHAEVLS